MTSELRVDKIIPTTGAPTGGGGGVIQVVSATKTDTQTFTSIGNFVNLFNISVAGSTSEIFIEDFKYLVLKSIKSLRLIG